MYIQHAFTARAVMRIDGYLRSIVVKSYNRRKLMKRIILGAVILLVVLIAAIVACALISYHKQPELTAGEIKQLDEQGIWKERTSAERARIIEDNDEALKERIRMISNAKSEIILSTFDFRSDDSGKLMLGALIDAADRGVSVNVIVGGVSGFTKMKGNPDFNALASSDNVNVKIYNKVNPFKPWQSMGRLHDKYVIADRTNYILGGRNTFNYFLGAYPGHKNYDRDVLVYCESPDETSSVNDVLAYYESVWNYKESKAFLKNNKCAGNKKVKAARKELLDNYDIYYADNKDYLTDTDYTDETVEVSNIALLSNPIECGAKKPVVWYQLTKLMEQADTQVKIHTPYIICNEYMYDGLKKVCDSVENVSLMTNSVGNNGNPFGSADYYAHKDKVLGTGLELGRRSVRGKRQVHQRDAAVGHIRRGKALMRQKPGVGQKFALAPLGRQNTHSLTPLRPGIVDASGQQFFRVAVAFQRPGDPEAVDVQTALRLHGQPGVFRRDVFNKAFAALHAAAENQPFVKALFEPFLFCQALLAGHGTADVLLVDVLFRDADIVHSRSLSFLTGTVCAFILVFPVLIIPYLFLKFNVATKHRFFLVFEAILYYNNYSKFKSDGLDRL